ncbi:hypothetical protein ANANG_G00090280 [Anguilla anguilla]|uniref:Uncharacterized protein n=1 Tax=Anguilla anguilla TaxID=7936 RepID=A0A9D3MLP0_ANGAN|nr:hypothetical protein ANANG_G00090280 [Anguilla anguilla]
MHHIQQLSRPGQPTDSVIITGFHAAAASLPIMPLWDRSGRGVLSARRGLPRRRPLCSTHAPAGLSQTRDRETSVRAGAFESRESFCRNWGDCFQFRGRG